MEEAQERSTTIAGIGRLRLAVMVVLAVAAGIVAWLLIRGGDDPAAPAKSVTAVSGAELAELPRTVGHPVYWAGPRPGHTYELTRTPEGRVYVRYLPAGVGVGDRRPDFLTVGTYPYPQAIEAARVLARRPGAFKRSLAGGGIAYSLPSSRKSVFFAFPRLDYLYEVFDPDPRRARRLVLSGRVRPVR